MKQCHKCGCANDNINSFCRNCGSAFEPVWPRSAPETDAREKSEPVTPAEIAAANLRRSMDRLRSTLDKSSAPADSGNTAAPGCMQMPAQAADIGTAEQTTLPQVNDKAEEDDAQDTQITDTQSTDVSDGDEATSAQDKEADGQSTPDGITVPETAQDTDVSDGDETTSAQDKKSRTPIDDFFDMYAPGPDHTDSDAGSKTHRETLTFDAEKYRQLFELLDSKDDFTEIPVKKAPEAAAQPTHTEAPRRKWDGGILLAGNICFTLGIVLICAALAVLAYPRIGNIERNILVLMLCAGAAVLLPLIVRMWALWGIYRAVRGESRKRMARACRLFNFAASLALIRDICVFALSAVTAAELHFGALFDTPVYVRLAELLPAELSHKPLLWLGGRYAVYVCAAIAALALLLLFNCISAMRMAGAVKNHAIHKPFSRSAGGMLMPLCTICGIILFCAGPVGVAVILFGISGHSYRKRVL